MGFCLTQVLPPTSRYNLTGQYSFGYEVKEGDKLAKIISIGGLESASIVEVTGVKNNGKNILIDGEEDVGAGVNSFNALTGRAVASYISGCFTRLMTVEDAKAAGIEFE